MFILKGSVKTLVSSSVSIALLSSIVVGCSPNTDNKEAATTKPTPGTTAPAPAKAAPATIKMFNRVNAAVVVENNPVIAEVEKLANVKLSVEAPPINNYVDKLQVLMASGDLPDLIYNWGGADANMEKWAQNDLIAPLDDKIKNYPNLTKILRKKCGMGSNLLMMERPISFQERM